MSPARGLPGFVRHRDRRVALAGGVQMPSQGRRPVWQQELRPAQGLRRPLQEKQPEGGRPRCSVGDVA
eukprot:10422653-Lingulodinium_polyedra.AAC.1